MGLPREAMTSRGCPLFTVAAGALECCPDKEHSLLLLRVQRLLRCCFGLRAMPWNTRHPRCAADRNEMLHYLGTQQPPGVVPLHSGRLRLDVYEHKEHSLLLLRVQR